MSLITHCNICNAECETDEYTTPQRVTIHIKVESNKRDFPQREGDFCSVAHAIEWLDKEIGDYIRKEYRSGII